MRVRLVEAKGISYAKTKSCSERARALPPQKKNLNPESISLEPGVRWEHSTSRNALKPEP